MPEPDDPTSPSAAGRVGRTPSGGRINSEMPAQAGASRSPAVAPNTASARPTSIRVVAALNFVICGLLLLFVVPAVLSILPYVSGARSNPGGSGIVLVLVGALAVVALPFVLLFLMTAMGTWRLRKWGLVCVFISCIVCLVSGLGTIYGIATSPDSGGFLTGSGLLSLLVVLAGSVQVYYLFQPGFRAQFR